MKEDVYMSEEEYIEYKKSLEIKINKALSNNSQKIIDSFVDYYGEQHRKEITEKYNNIVFIYYISNFLIYYILNKALQKKRNGEKEEYGYVLGLCLYLYTSGTYNKYLTKDNIKQQDFDLLMKKLIGVSKDTVLNDPILFILILCMIYRKEEDNPYEYSFLSNDMKSLNTIIALPIFSINDKILIHEINHAICTNIVRTTENNEQLIQSGLNISNDPTSKKTMELVNDAQANRIYDIFKNKYGGKIFTDLTIEIDKKETEQKEYDAINLFFEPFENELKETCLGGDFNILFDKIDTNSFQLICSIINSESDEKEKAEKISEIINNIKKRQNYKVLI